MFAPGAMRVHGLDVERLLAVPAGRVALGPGVVKLLGLASG